MLYTTSRKGGKAIVNGETVEVLRMGKATSGSVSYIVMFMGRNGTPTQFDPGLQATISTSLVEGMTTCRATAAPRAGAGDVLDFIGGVPEQRFIVPVQC